MPKARTLTIAVLACSAIISLGFATQPARSKKSSPFIHKKMERMDEALDSLTEAIEAGETKAALKDLTTLQKNLIDAKAQVPGTIKALDSEQREIQTIDYRKRLSEALKTLCDVEILVLDGENQAATTMLTETLANQRRAGHKLYQPKRGG